MQDARQESLARGRTLLVYVGAAWCEPCVRFEQALAGGALDTRLPGLDLLEFDADEDRERLEAAGYSSRLIPLFCVPDARGRATSRRVEGSIKGPGAVEQLVPRVAALMEPSPG